MKKLITIRFFILLILCLFYGCRKDKEQTLPEVEPGMGLIKINMSLPTYENDTSIGSRSISGVPELQIHQVKLNEEVNLIAELTPENANSAKVSRAVVSEPLAPNTRYKVTVFNMSGVLVAERNYVYQHEEETEPLILDADVSYTFIAYSTNSTNDDLPTWSFPSQNPSDQKLQFAAVRGVKVGSDFMYFRKEMNVSGNGINYLDIVFEHKASQVNVVFDCSLLGSGAVFREINEPAFIDKPTNYNVMLSSAAVNVGNEIADASTTFPNLGSNLITSRPVSFYPVLKNGTYTSEFRIKNLRLGTIRAEDGALLFGVFVTNIRVSDLNIVPGTRYKLTVRLTPNDKFGAYMGRAVARIGGQVWERYNVGALSQPVLLPPETPKIVNWGNQYTWGYKAMIGTGSTISPVSGFQSLLPIKQLGTAWNAGVQTFPLKSSDDPCSAGFRVPTLHEFAQLLSYTTKDWVGTWNTLTPGELSNSNTNTSAIQLTSKTNNGVILTFPAVGARNNVTGNLESYNQIGRYQTSDTGLGSLNNAYNLIFQRNNFAVDGLNLKSNGISIRCIAETLDNIKID